MLHIIVRHLAPNPKKVRTSRRRAQETESKAFVISNLRRILASSDDVGTAPSTVQA